MFRSTGRVPGDLYQKPTSGAGVEELLVASDQVKIAHELVGGRPVPAVSQHRPADERRPLGRADGGRSQAVGVPEDPFRETLRRVLAGRPLGGLQSNESGRTEIYVRPFVPPGAAGTAPAAAGASGRCPRRAASIRVWRPDGKELYYLNPAGAMMAAPITVTGATLEPGAPVVLFPTRIFGGGVDAARAGSTTSPPTGAS